MDINLGLEDHQDHDHGGDRRSISIIDCNSDPDQFSVSDLDGELESFFSSDLAYHCVSENQGWKSDSKNSGFSI